MHKRKHMEGYVVESTCGAGSGVCGSSESHKLKKKLLFPCADRMISELQKHFSGVNEELLKGIQACSPTSDVFLCKPYLSGLALHYHIDLKSEEVMVASNNLRRKREAGEIKDILTVYNLLDMFPSLKAVFQVALTIPVSSCSCERSFSALHRLHTWLRRSVEQSRLQHLAVMSIDKEVFARVTPDAVINRFANLKVRRNSLIVG